MRRLLVACAQQINRSEQRRLPPCDVDDDRHATGVRAARPSTTLSQARLDTCSRYTQTGCVFCSGLVCTQRLEQTNTPLTRSG
eukprot:m.479268 g.479268  ORF g.479268 m.479268 type:complete len:83 (-) comp21386_c0_seq1:177-425(-)